jgi:hypothetical protein
MRIPVETLLNGVSRTLLEQVLPHVASRPARGQLYAAVDVLRNAAKRLDWASAPLETEAQSAESALRTAASRLREAGGVELARDIEARLPAWPAAPASARAGAARAELARVFEALDALPSELADAVRPILGGHLAAQAVRALALLQPSLLEEISRG